MLAISFQEMALYSNTVKQSVRQTQFKHRKHFFSRVGSEWDLRVEVPDLMPGVPSASFMMI